jgi:hypothetical protein
MNFELRARVIGVGGRYATTEEHAASIAYLLAEILPLSGRVFATADNTCGAVSLEIRHIPTHSGEIELDETSSLIYSITPIAFLECSAQVYVNEAGAFRNMWVPKPNQSSALEVVAKRRFEEAIASLALATSIGCSDQRLSTPQFLPKGSEFEPSIQWGDVGRGRHISKEIGWPPLQTIGVKRVLDWLEALPGWQNGIGQGPVARSVAALSQALATEGRQDSALSLIWAMVGLEALFCRHHEGLKSQLSTNVQLLLGKWSSHKKRFGKVYDFRSAFLHGVLDLPFAHRGRQDDEAAWRFIWDSDEEAGLAMVTLLASIQELIMRDWRELEFATEIRGA